VNRGDLTLEECETTLENYRKRLEHAFAETQADHAPPPAWSEPEAEPEEPAVDTGAPRERLAAIVDALVTWPEGFAPHPKLERILKARRKQFNDDAIDWALAEQLAFGTLLQEGVPVRIAGQDTRRGTFSQRHAVLVDHATEREHTPLERVATNARFMIYDSVLSEFAALGFEYGYSVAGRDALVCWEAQFGDFANGGQVVIDQFIVAAEDKWGERSTLTLLLPHGFEGQGPEHSSARLERFLASCAEDNLRVTYPTTAAQYFHVLRRQIHEPRRKPLVVLTPKRYLRVPATYSPVADFVGGHFQLVLPDPRPPAGGVERLVLCTGKLGHELIAHRDALAAPVAVVRIEQLYPWPEREILDRCHEYPDAEVVWAQEEPENMGAARFAVPRLAALVGRPVPVVARRASASPATGSHTVHDAEQRKLIEEAVGF
jgi:2-oxoglutarate dehydrogenase complex dehydrogenase (E1) component-like enzyme